MLVLSRKRNESIMINDEITVIVVDIRRDNVRLGVDAPKEVPIHRTEIYEALKREDKRVSELESKTTQASISAHRQFIEYLRNDQYSEAFKIYSDNKNIVSFNELHQLTKGLGRKLQEYER